MALDTPAAPQAPAAPGAPAAPKPGVPLQMELTPAMRSFLRAASQDARLTQEVKEQAAAALSAGDAAQSVPWQTVKAVVAAHNAAAQPAPPVLLHELCRGSNIVLPAPPAKPPNPQLEARRKELQGQLEDKLYASMVADITQAERRAASMQGMLPTYRAQLSFGAHVLVTMFTGFALGYWGSKIWLGWDELWAGLLGALGLTAGMLLETVLLIVRSNLPPPLEKKFPHLFDPKVYNKPRSRTGRLLSLLGVKVHGQQQGPSARQASGAPSAASSSSGPAGSSSRADAAGATAETKKRR